MIRPVSERRTATAETDLSSVTDATAYLKNRYEVNPIIY